MRIVSVLPCTFATSNTCKGRPRPKVNRLVTSTSALIGRSPIDGTFNGGSAPGVNTSTSNLGTDWTSGYDIEVRYRLPLRPQSGRLASAEAA